VTPLTTGGDHTISYPILKVLGAFNPLRLVHIDAHTDTWDSFAGSRFMHGTPFRRVVEAGAIDPRCTISYGVHRRPAKVGTIRVTKGCALFAWTRSRLSALKAPSGRRTVSSLASRVIYPSTSCSTPPSPQALARQR
jgi:arginase family enzyme